MSSTPSGEQPVQGVNVMLGGAMLSGIILVIFVMCYCCHKNARKWESNVPTHVYCGRDWTLPLQVYTVQANQFTHSDMQSTITGTGPPPAYEAVVPTAKNSLLTTSPSQAKYHHDQLLQPTFQQNNVEYWNELEDESGLPTYDAAVQQNITEHYPQIHI